MSWNYRIIEFVDTASGQCWREVREVYYDDQGRPVAYGQVAHLAWDSDDAEAPSTILKRISESIEKPILPASQFETTPHPIEP